MTDVDSVLDEIEDRQPWDRREDESPRDYARFNAYRMQPPGQRSKNQVFIEMVKGGDQDASLADGAWYEMVRRFEWDSRVAAWDKHQIEQRLANEQQERLDARRLRREQMQASIDLLDDLIQKAKETGNSSEARLLLGERRLYLAELRREHGDEITKVEKVDPNATIDVVIQGLTTMTKANLPALHPAQLTVARAIDKEARFGVLAAGRRFGKTNLGVELCIMRAARRGRCWWVAPDTNARCPAGAYRGAWCGNCPASSGTKRTG